MLVSPLRLALALALAGAASGEGAPPRGMGFGLAATARTLLEPLYSRLARAPSLRANCAFAAPPAKWRAASKCACSCRRVCVHTHHLYVRGCQGETA